MLSLLAESWTWYSFACVILIARYISRWLQLGSIKRYQVEDYIMLVVFCFFTILVTCMNMVAHLDTNLMLPSDIPTLTPETTASRIHGSKLVLVVEQSMITTIWGCKICLLLLYRKITFGLRQQIAVNILIAYVIVNWLVMESLYFGVWCRPFNQYWAVPVANEQCSAAIHHLIINAIFNISSDIMILGIPIPLLLTSRLPRSKKLILCCLFGLGIFVILCAVLNKYFSFVHPFSPMWTFWYIREASTAIFVANIPVCWTLVRWFFDVHSFNSSGDVTEMKSRTRVTGTGTRSVARIASTSGVVGGSNVRGSKRISSVAHDIEMKIQPEGDRDLTDVRSWEDESRLESFGRNESEEFIFVPDDRPNTPLEIWESREFHVVNDEVRSESPVLCMAANEEGESYGTETGIGKEKEKTEGHPRFKSTTTVTALKTLES